MICVNNNVSQKHGGVIRRSFHLIYLSNMMSFVSELYLQKIITLTLIELNKYNIYDIYKLI